MTMLKACTGKESRSLIFNYLYRRPDLKNVDQPSVAQQIILTEPNVSSESTHVVNGMSREAIPQITAVVIDS